MLVRKGIIACCLSFVDYPKEKWQVGSVERVGNTALSCRRRQRRTALFPRRPWFCCAAGHDYEEAFYQALGLTTHNHPFFFPFFVKKEERVDLWPLLSGSSPGGVHLLIQHTTRVLKCATRVLKCGPASKSGSLPIAGTVLHP